LNLGFIKANWAITAVKTGEESPDIFPLSGGKRG